jgi:RHS repeat-associated protein
LNGRLIDRQVSGGGPRTTYAWDSSDRLISADVGADGQADFQASYDYRTRRLSTVEGGVTTHFRYDGGECFQELHQGALAVELVRAGGLGGGIGSILYTDRSQSSGPVESFTVNPVGHTVGTTNASGSVESSNRYEAFGALLATAGSSANNRLANTKERSLSLGLDNHGFRYYDPALGRYLSRDPAGFVDGLNVYLYVRGNPINRIDPLGLSKEPSIWTRLGGAWRMVGGLAEASLGVAAMATTSPTVVGAALGATALVHGTDTFAAGLQELATGIPADSLTEQGVFPFG